MKKIEIAKHLLSIDGIGAKTVIALFERFSDAEEIFRADLAVLSKIIGEKTAKKIIASRKLFRESKAKFESELEKLEKLGAELICYFNDEFPETLRNIGQPPIFLYLLGDKKLLSEASVAIVGTRKPTRYGLKQAGYFAEKLVENDIAVTSGLARGIDTQAHKSALANAGKTIAVLGSGLDYIYPPENKSLFYEIAEKGLIVSEYPLGTKPDAVNFPRRNRIISGLSLGSLIVETRITGGALRTAAYALEQGREVFAVPGNIGAPQSEGTNRLIQRGEAKLVVSINDILEELRISSKTVEKQASREKTDLSVLDVFEQKVYEVLSEKPLHIDNIASVCRMSASECSVYLLNLELKGFAEQLPGKYFVKA